MGLSEKTQFYMDLTEKYSTHHYGRWPVLLAEGRGSYVFDPSNATPYIDMLAGYGVANFGHNHPYLVARRGQAIASGLSAAFSNMAYNVPHALLCQQLALFSRLPEAKCMIMNTGMEAVEKAIKIVRMWGYRVKGVENNRAEILVSDTNFHGRSTTIIGFSAELHYRFQFGPFAPKFSFRQVKFGSIRALEEVINKNTVAFLVEPIQGEGGFIFPPEDYFKQVREICDRHNILWISDEIPTAFGRTGDDLPHEHDGVLPDMIILGKALGGGLDDVSAVVGRGEVMNVIQPGHDGSTFGGNALACAIGLAVMDLFATNPWSIMAREKGNYFLRQLRQIDSPKIKEVRGRGLFIGVEMAGGVGAAHEICRRLVEEGIWTTNAHDAVRFTPPLIIEESLLDSTVQAFRKVLGC